MSNLSPTVSKKSGSAVECGGKVTMRGRCGFSSATLFGKQSLSDALLASEKSTRTGGILRGVDADYNKYPFMAAILRKDVFECNGFVIKSRWIISYSKCYRDAMPRFGAEIFFQNCVNYRYCLSFLIIFTTAGILMNFLMIKNILQ